MSPDSDPVHVVQNYPRFIPGVKMTESYVKQCSTNKKDPRGNDLTRITHLSLNDRKLTRMENL